MSFREGSSSSIAKLTNGTTKESVRISPSQTTKTANTPESNFEIKSVEFESSTPSISKESSSKLLLTPWEKWLIEKSRQERHQLQRKLAESRNKHNEELKGTAEEARKRELINSRYQSWLASKNEALRRRKQKVKQDAEIKLRNELKKRLEIKEKCNEAYNSWHSIKVKEEKERISKLRTKENQAETKNMLKIQANQEAFSNFLRRTSDFTPPEYRCYGISCGKLISWKC